MSMAQSEKLSLLLAPTIEGGLPENVSGTKSGTLSGITSGTMSISHHAHPPSTSPSTFRLDMNCDKQSSLTLHGHTRGCECHCARAGISSGSKQIAGLWCSVIFLTILMLTSFFLPYHRCQDSDQTHTLLSEYHSLQQDYLELRQEVVQLREQFVSHVSEELSHDDDDDLSYSDESDRKAPESSMQELFSSDKTPVFPDSKLLPKRPKRSAGHHVSSDHVRSLVIEHLRSLPKAHLNGINDLRHVETNIGDYILWQQDTSPARVVKRHVEFVHQNHQHNRIVALRILQTGLYVVYSQVIINGTTSATVRRDCAHETVVIDTHSASPHPQILMSSYLTQDEEGRYPNHSIPYPRDTSLQMGIFRLIRQSQVRVRIPNHDDCRLTRIGSEFHSSYFGLFRIG